MSGKITGAVLTHGPTPTTLDRDGQPYGWSRARAMRAVLVVIADAANMEGEHSHPGKDTLVSASLYSRTRVTKVLADLVAEGWISVTSQGGGRGKATEYRVMPLTALRPESGVDWREARCEVDVEQAPDGPVSDLQEQAPDGPVLAKPATFDAKPAQSSPVEQGLSVYNGKTTTRPTPPTPPQAGGRSVVSLSVLQGLQPLGQVASGVEQTQVALQALGLSSLTEVDSFPQAIDGWYASQVPAPLIERRKVEKLGTEARRAGWEPGDFLFALCGSNVATGPGLDLFVKRLSRGDFPGMGPKPVGARDAARAEGKRRFAARRGKRAAGAIEAESWEAEVV